jgi:4-nitrophenyl phosphatase
MGFDLRFNYRKLAKANHYLRRNPGCHFFATNTDAQFPNAGLLYPGTGCFVSALSVACGQDPVVFGKPHPTMLECILDKFKLDPRRCLMVGDRIDTDILFGKQGGLKTLCVLTGVTRKGDLEELDCTIQPDYVLESVAGLNTS